jgi:hypothetical protein
MNTLRLVSQNTGAKRQLFKLLAANFDDVRQAFDLFAEFLCYGKYNAGFCLKLLSIAKQETGVPWNIRRLATLMLEHQTLKLHPHNVEDFDFLLTHLGLKKGLGFSEGIVSSVLKEGYSTTDPHRFIVEFRRKLERLNRIHEKITGEGTPESVLRDFIELSRSDCKLSLARYLFTPEEIVDQILRLLLVTDGAKDLDISQPAFVEIEMQRARTLLPEFEARILTRLCQASNIYWVADTTSSELNSLVEYPATTVVLVIKPPGSDIEFEIKRAGRKSHNPLKVVYARNGFTVPPSHRLDGGSMQWLLRYEQKSASQISLIYRLAHRREAPIPKYISRSTIYSVPVQGAEVQTLMYFTQPQTSETGFREMRLAMEEVVAAFRIEGYANLPHLPGDLGLTAQFIGIVAPAQAVLTGTSSFRLDKLAAYLSGSGPQTYFEQGLEVGYSRDDAKRLADTILDEVLGVYHAPDVSYKNYEQYVTTAFRLTANRARADRFYLSLLKQIATFWGTLLAARGFSRGESFVARNVGLKSCWEAGEWKVNIIFMDHDAVVMPGFQNSDLDLHSTLSGMALDETYIWGRSNSEEFSASEVGYLQKIYQVNEDVCEQGQALAQTALRDAYKETQRELLTNAKLQSLLGKAFIERLLDLDALFSGYLQLTPETLASTRWKQEMKMMLSMRGYKARTCDLYIDAIETNRAFLARYAFLFDDTRR